MKAIVGDLITLAKDGEFDVILHGCNCYQTMGSGIAPAIKKAWPGAYEADCNTSLGNERKLGYYSSYTENGLTILNCYIQYAYNKKFLSDRVEYTKLGQLFTSIADTFSDKSIAYPKIGGGRAGGDWDKIYSVIQACFDGLDHTLILWEKEK